MIKLTRRHLETPSKLRGFHDYEQRLGDEMRGRRASLGKSILDVRHDLGLKPCTIRAIEECDDQSFDSPAFIAGAVRRYARYLGLDPDEVYARFRVECGWDRPPETRAFREPSMGAGAGKGPTGYSSATIATSPRYSRKRRDGLLSSIGSGLSLTGIGSSLMLVTLISGISYLGWSVYQEFKRLPSVQVTGRTTVEPVSVSVGTEQGDTGDISLVGDVQAGVYAPFSANSSGPLSTIGEIEPGSIGATLVSPAERESREVSLDASLPSGVRQTAGNDVAAEEMPLTVIVTRPSWMRISMEDGTVLLERILAAGEEYVVPDVEGPLTLRSGNSGYVYFVVGQQVFGPAGSGTGTVRNIDLSKDSIRVAFSEVSESQLPTEVMNVIQLTESRR